MPYVEQASRLFWATLYLSFRLIFRYSGYSELVMGNGAKRFSVALSFPGEHRDFVGAVAEHLAEKLGRSRALYDSRYESEFARINLDDYRLIK
jgi:hypothetical protein